MQLAQPATTQLVAAEAERDALAQELDSLRRARAHAEREAAEIKDHALGESDGMMLVAAMQLSGMLIVADSSDCTACETDGVCCPDLAQNKGALQARIRQLENERRDALIVTRSFGACNSDRPLACTLT